MHRKLDVLVDKVAAHGVEVTNFGMVDNAQGAYALLPKLKAANLDLIFCDMVTYATSATFGILIRELDVPIVLVALQPLQGAWTTPRPPPTCSWPTTTSARCPSSPAWPSAWASARRP